MNKSFRDYFREWETTDAERQANNRVPIYILGGFALLILVVNACLLSC